MPSDDYLAALAAERDGLAVRPESAAQARRLAAVERELAAHRPQPPALEDAADHTPVEAAVPAKRGPGRPRKESSGATG